jgi:hypothetical protein
MQLKKNIIICIKSDSFPRLKRPESEAAHLLSSITLYEDWCCNYTPLTSF